jgi:hypothetical protein
MPLLPPHCSTVSGVGTRRSSPPPLRGGRCGAGQGSRAVATQVSYAAFASQSAITSRSNAWSVIPRRLARRSSSSHVLSVNRTDRGDEPTARVPLLGLPRRAFSKARARRRPAAPLPSTTALEKSSSGISRNDAALGSTTRFLLVFFITSLPPCADPTRRRALAPKMCNTIYLVRQSRARAAG